MNLELEQFAESVRRQAHDIYVAAMMGRSELAAQRASALLTEAANVKNQHQMLEEQAGGYDLAALPAPSGCADPE